MKVKELKKLLKNMKDEEDVCLFDHESGHLNDVVRVEYHRTTSNRTAVVIFDFGSVSHAK